MYVRSMVEAGVLEGLAAVAPGPELAVALAALDPTEVPGDQLVEVLRAQARQCAHEQARLWASMVEVGLAEPVDDPAGPSCDASTARGGPVAEWAPGEIAAALTWTHRTADWELGLATSSCAGYRTSSLPCRPGRSTAARPWCSLSTSTPLTASPPHRPRRSWPGCCRSRPD